MKKLFILLFCLLVIPMIAFGAYPNKVLVKTVGGDPLIFAAAPYVRYWQLTWATSGAGDSLYTSVISDTAQTDQDTTNVFVVAGLMPWSNSLDSTTVAALVFRAVADTTIDSLTWVLDYSFDKSTWFVGTNYRTLLTLARDAALDTMFVQPIKTNPAVRQGGEVLAPYWRLRVQCSNMNSHHAINRKNSDKKLKQLYAYFYAGARPR